MEKIFCPLCPPRFNRRKDKIGVCLDLIESNYSGCGEDIMSCPECAKTFSISYKVDEITRIPDWEDKEEVARLEKCFSEKRCPICGYTQEDADKWKDHHLCEGRIPK